MKNLELINFSPDERIDLAIKRSMVLYCNRLKNGYYPIGLEATFQFYFARILESVLSTLVIRNDEMFQVLLEDNNRIGEENDYVDIVVDYKTSNSDSLKYLIELKFKKKREKESEKSKKKSDGGTNDGVIKSYIDMYNLDRQKKEGNCRKGYFIFLTNLQTYKNMPRNGLREKLPMYDGAKIFANRDYTDNKNVFCFSDEHNIEYNEFDVKDEKFWYFIETF